MPKHKLLSFKAVLTCGTVGCATRIRVGVRSGENLFGDADTVSGDLGYHEIGSNLVRFCRILAGIKSENQPYGHQFSGTTRHAPFSFWSQTRKTTAHNIPKFERVLLAPWRDDFNVRPQVTFLD